MMYLELGFNLFMGYLLITIGMLLSLEGNEKAHLYARWFISLMFFILLTRILGPLLTLVFIYFAVFYPRRRRY